MKIGYVRDNGSKNELSLSEEVDAHYIMHLEEHNISLG